MSTIARSVAIQLRHSLLAVLLAGAWSVCRAEVSVVVEPQTGHPVGGLILLSAIVDGPDPILGIWARHGQPAGRAVLNESGDLRGDGPPLIFGNPIGLCAVAWAKHNPTGFDIVLSRFVQGAWTTEETLADSTVDELDPSLIASPDGSIRLFYWEMGTIPRILSRVATPDMSSWGPPEQVSEAGEVAVRPFPVYHQGTLWVVYEVHDYGLERAPRQVVAAHLEGNEWVRQVLAVSWSEEPLRPEIHSRVDALWVDWIDAPGQVRWLRRDGATSWTSIQSLPYSTVLERDFFSRGSVKHFVLQ